MRIKNILRHASIFGMSAFLITTFTTSVFAQGVGLGQGRNSNVPNVPSSPGTSGQSRSCQARENAIKNRMAHLTQLATTMESKFDSITTRVENFYTSKLVPSGKTVANYNALVADIQTKKTAVGTALAKAQTDANSFSCTNGSPKTQMAQFKDDMQTVKKALKDFRTAIKNLIVAVHSVTGIENRKSPKPTK